MGIFFAKRRQSHPSYQVCSFSSNTQINVYFKKKVSTTLTTRAHTMHTARYIETTLC